MVTTRELLNKNANRRETRRKRLIREIIERDYAGGPVLLDELRWKVRWALGDESPEITRSWQNSFARTIREQFPQYVRHKITLKRTSVGLVARAALYRLKSTETLRQFLQSEDACILCRYRTQWDSPYGDEPWWDGLRDRYVRGRSRSAATFRFFVHRPAAVIYSTIEDVPGTFIPGTHRIEVVAPSSGMQLDHKLLTRSPWKLFGYGDNLSDWFEVDPMASLRDVKRNPRT